MEALSNREMSSNRYVKIVKFKISKMCCFAAERWEQCQHGKKGRIVEISYDLEENMKRKGEVLHKRRGIPTESELSKLLYHGGWNECENCRQY